MCVLIFSTNSSETFLILRKIQRDIAINVHNTFSCKIGYPLFLSGFNETWIFSTDFFKKSANIKFHENSSSGSRVVPCGPADRRETHVTKLTFPFRDFANWPKNQTGPLGIRIGTEANINPVKANGYFMYHFMPNSKTSYILPIHCIYAFFFRFQNKQLLFPYASPTDFIL